MNFTTIREAIEGRFISNWSDNNVAFENVPYKTPDEQNWARLSVQFVSNEYNGLGECREIIGLVGVQLYSPVRRGTLRQEQFADEAVNIFSGSHDGIAYRDADVISVGEVDGWYQLNILVEFTAKG